ncbi:hypothetical protein BDV3_004019 [Batrachochytrium dendrobatidis]
MYATNTVLPSNHDNASTEDNKILEASPPSAVSHMGRRRMSWHAIKRNDSTANEQSLKSLINAAGVGNIMGISGSLPTSNEAQLDQIIPNFVSKQVRRVCYQMCAEVALKADGGSQDPLVIPPLVPSATEAFAAVVMVDVSGYSKLTAVLAERGPIGAELLTRTMKGYLDKIIQTIVAHGGDIVKFAGDAVIFCWKSEKATNLTEVSRDKIRGELVYKASHCCLTLLTKLGTYDIDIEDCPTKILRIHLGIGAGLVYDVLVGGEPGRWEHFIAGDGVNQLSQVLDLAKAGELALSHQALKWLACVIDIATVNLGDYDKRCIILTGLEKAVRKGHAPPDIEDEIIFKNTRQMEANVDLYKLFVDRTALFKLQADINQSRLFQMDAGLLDLLNLTELRQVTTIFIKVGSLQVVHRNDILDESQRAISIVQTALHRCEGSLRQFHVDDKGAVILCFFGLPPLAHENDACLGIKAGIEIRDKFLDIFDDFSMGITTGVVSYGGVGSGGRAEYAVMGDSINMAARLMCHTEAAEGILCDEKTYNLCCSDYTFQNLGETKVKGKNSAISIFRPIVPVPESNKNKTNQNAALSIAAEVIGREKERKSLLDSLERMKTATVSDVMIVKADGGQGLSTLIAYTKEEATKQQCHVCVGNCVEMEKTTFYFPWQSIVQDLVELIMAGNFDSENRFILTTQPLQNLNVSQNLSGAVSPLATTENFKADHILASSITKDIFKFRMQENVSAELNQTQNAESGLLSNLCGTPVQQFITTPSSTVHMGAKPRRMSIIKPSNSDEFLSERALSASRGRQISTVPVDVMSDIHEIESFIPKIAQALVKINEESDEAGLFELILPAKIDGEIDIEVQTKLQLHLQALIGLLTKMIQTLSAHNKLIFVFNEAQWMDSLSWELLLDILGTCPRAAVYIFTRPEGSFDCRDSKVCLKRIEALPRSTTLSVGGLNINEAHRLIVTTWATQSVLKVSPKIVESIYKRTDGNPFFIRSLTVAMKESGQWRVSPDGVLSTQNGDFDFEKLVLGYDHQSIIVAQFDRLDRNFQLFLKVAAVLGQRFLLDDVLFFLTGMTGVFEQIDRKNYNQIIRGVQTTDKYGFLQRENTTLDGILFQFKSAVVRKCIYSMMVLKQRQQLHKHVATYYETRLNDANRHRYLIPIFEHFMEADNSQTRKKIHYLEMVASFYYERGFVNECIKFYKQLLDIAGLFRKDLPEGMEFKNATIANWHRELGHSLYLKEEYIEAEKHLLIGLKLYGAVFPDSNFGIYWATRKQLRIRAKKDAVFFQNFVNGLEESTDYIVSYRAQKSVSWHSLNNFGGTANRRPDPPNSRGSVVIPSLLLSGALGTGPGNTNPTCPEAGVPTIIPSSGSNLIGSNATVPVIVGGSEAPIINSNGRTSLPNLVPQIINSSQGNSAAHAHTSAINSTSIGGSSNHALPEYDSLPIPHARVSQNISSGTSSKYGIRDRNTSQNLIREPGSARQGPTHGIQHILLILADLYWICNQFPKHRLCVLMGLNMVQENTQDSILSKLFSLGSLTLWMTQAKPFRALSYLDAAQRLDGRTDIHTSIYVSTNQCVLMFLMGRFQVALKATDGLHYLGTIASDTLIRIRALKLRLYIQTLSGPYQTTLSTAKDLFTFATQRECMGGRFTACLKIIQCLFCFPEHAKEIPEMVKILDDIWSTRPAGSLGHTDEMAYFGAKIHLRHVLGLPFKISDFVEFSDALVKCTSYEWELFQGILSVGFAIFAAHEAKMLEFAFTRKVIDMLCTRICCLLKPMKGLLFSNSLRRIFKGFKLIQAKQRSKAIACWLKGIDEQSEAVLLQAILNRLIAHNTQNTTEMGVFDARAKRLVDAIQVTYLFESIWK